MPAATGWILSMLYLSTVARSSILAFVTNLPLSPDPGFSAVVAAHEAMTDNPAAAAARA
jgi:hypothetical protein